MNQRIRELEDQCWEDVPVDIDYDYLSRVRRVFNREKFAELIVKECAAQCDPEPGLKYSPNAASSRSDCKEKILNHFGVEQ